MKNKTIICGILAGTMIGFGVTRCMAEDDDQAALQAKAKVSKQTARQTAQAQVPNGKVKESELEMENGKLIWSFGFTIPNSKDIKEVNIDAVTGEMVGAIETETPETQAREAAEDAANARAKNKAARQAKLMSKVKVSKDAALQTAQAKVPNGTLKECELEKEKGKLIWSFCFTIPDSQDIKEVNVNARNGRVVGDVETETLADRANEAAEDAAKARKHGGDKEDKD